jgi:hypothetical protein
MVCPTSKHEPVTTTGPALGIFEPTDAKGPTPPEAAPHQGARPTFKWQTNSMGPLTSGDFASTTINLRPSPNEHSSRWGPLVRESEFAQRPDCSRGPKHSRRWASSRPTDAIHRPSPELPTHQWAQFSPTSKPAPTPTGNPMSGLLGPHHDHAMPAPPTGRRRGGAISPKPTPCIGPHVPASTRHQSTTHAMPVEAGQLERMPHETRLKLG